MRLFTVPKNNLSFSTISRLFEAGDMHGGNLVLPWKGVDNAVASLSGHMPFLWLSKSSVAAEFR